MIKIKGICLVAPHGAGKSTAYQTVIDNCSQLGLSTSSIKELKFAGRLKEVIAELLGVEIIRLDDQDFKKMIFEKPFILNEINIRYILDRFEMDFIKYDPFRLNTHIGVELTSPRHCMQYIATEFLRDLEPSIHTDILIKDANDNLDKLVIVTDCNFLNEFQVCNEMNFLSIGIYQEDICKNLAKQIEDGEVHESQKHVPSLLERCDIKIQNNSTLEAFQQQIIQSLKEVL